MNKGTIARWEIYLHFSSGQNAVAKCIPIRNQEQNHMQWIISDIIGNSWIL